MSIGEHQSAHARDWTPQLSADGVFYCSPLCGGGRHCRKEWYDAAVAKANTLVERLGQGWRPVVHENPGWHYRVCKGIVTVHEYNGGASGSMTKLSSERAYSAWIEPPIGRQFIEYGPTPEEALERAKTAARDYRDNLVVQLSEVLG